MENQLIKITENENGQKLVSARELHEFLGNKRQFADWIKQRISQYDFVENTDYKTFAKYRENSNNHRPRIEYYLTLNMAKSIVLLERNCNKEKMDSLLNELYLHDNKIVKVIEPKRKEVKFIELLKDSLEPLNIIGECQYNVLGKYRIDYYIKELNLAVEYDENNHDSYTYEKQEGRQLEIERELGCKFIRVTDKHSDGYNLGTILNEIYNIIEKFKNK